jgi:hypothetical protein
VAEVTNFNSDDLVRFKDFVKVTDATLDTT